MFELTTDADLGVQEAVIRVLHYYAMFNHPLNANEIHGSCSKYCSFPAIITALNNLYDANKIYNCGEYYSQQNNIKELIERREKGYILALEKEKSARISGKIISWFPFVKFVGISGSLSKGNVGEKDDFDFFIVTETNRLWISYTLLHLFKKMTFLFGLQHNFCMNYFVDTSNLSLDQQNIFIAIELASLIPLHDSVTYKQLINANKWTVNYLPNTYVKFKKVDIVNDKKAIIKSALETIINLFWPTRLNEKLMQIIDKRRRKKWQKNNLPAEQYHLAFNTSLHVSKNHRADRQKWIMKKLSEAGFDLR